MTLDPMRVARLLGGTMVDQEGVTVIHWGSVRLNANYSLWLGQRAAEVQATAAGVPAMQYLLVGPYRLESGTGGSGGRRLTLALADLSGHELALAADLPPTFLVRSSRRAAASPTLTATALQEAAVLLDATLQADQGALQLQWGGERNSLQYRVAVAAGGAELRLVAAWRGQTVARLVLEQPAQLRFVRGGLEFVVTAPQQEVIVRAARGGPVELRTSPRR